MTFRTALAAAVLAALLTPRASSQVVQFDITDPSGKDLPAKITFLGPDGKPPEKLALKSRLPEYAARKNVVLELYGKGEIPVPAGRYKAYVSRGLEWSAAALDLEVTPGRPACLKAVLERVVDTRGYLSADFHLHTLTFSKHGDANVEERIIALCAENVEWAVATDHNTITDYAPYARRLGVDRWLLTTPGSEVSTSTIGHLNTFPLDPKSKPVNQRIPDPRELFRKMRENPLDEIVQVNHPRWTGQGGAYFRSVGLSPITGDFWSDKVSLEFDSMEILNDNTLGGWELRTIPGGKEPDFDQSVREDWFNLLNRGLNFTGVGNSDSHYVEQAVAGCPRNFIACPADDPAAARVEDLVRAVRERRVTVSGGIFVTMVSGGGLPTGSTVRTSGGEVELEVKVQAAPWIDADRVAVIGNGEVVFRRDLPGSKDSPRPVVRFHEKLRCKPGIDTWYIACAEGDEPPYPMLPKVTAPLGFTNPIWVDADGDGKFTTLRDLARRAIEPAPGADRIAPEDLARRLEGSTAAFRRQVLGALSVSSSKDRAGLLGTLLTDRDGRVREGAATILARIGGEEALRALAAARDRAVDPWERFAIGREIVRAGDLSALEDMRSLSAKAKDAVLYRMRNDLKELCGKTRMDRWWTIGPFPAATVEAGLAAAFPPEKEIDYRAKYPGADGKTVEWKRISAESGNSVSFSALQPNEKALAYATVTVHAKEKMKTCLLLGAKCGLEIRLAGKTVHRQKSSEHRSVGSQVVPVEIPAGQSRILVKAVVDKGDFSFGLMAIDPAGNLRFEAPKLPEGEKKEKKEKKARQF